MCIQYESSVATEEAMSGFYVYSRNRKQVFGEFGTDTMAALNTHHVNLGTRGYRYLVSSGQSPWQRWIPCEPGTRRGHVAISVRLQGLDTLDFVLHCQMQGVELCQ